MKFRDWEVYHVREFLADLRDPAGYNFPADYERVARVTAPDIEDVFRLTNHIDRDWVLNYGVIAFGESHRSTSVGDVVVDLDEHKAYRCEPIGWQEIEHAEKRA